MRRAKVAKHALMCQRFGEGSLQKHRHVHQIWWSELGKIESSCCNVAVMFVSRAPCGPTRVASYLLLGRSMLYADADGKSGHSLSRGTGSLPSMR